VVRPSLLSRWASALDFTGRVVHCSRVAGGWRVGCAVSPPFSPAELPALA
jgi:hypothetical protein